MHLQVRLNFEREFESHIDDMIRDLRMVLNANDYAGDFTVYDNTEYAGEIDEPAGIVSGEVIINVETSRPKGVLDDIIPTAQAYEIPSIEIDY